MKGEIIIFKLGKETTRGERARFWREFYGYVDRSNHGRYIYERTGLLSKVPHSIPTRSVIVVNRKDAEPVLDFLRGWGACVYSRDIVITDEDLKKLGEC